MMPETVTDRRDNGSDGSCRFMSPVGTIVSRRRTEVEARCVAVDSFASGEPVNERERIVNTGQH